MQTEKDQAGHFLCESAYGHDDHFQIPTKQLVMIAKADWIVTYIPALSSLQPMTVKKQTGVIFFKMLSFSFFFFLNINFYYFWVGLLTEY